MKHGVLFLKILASVLSAAVIVVLLLFGDDIPTWIGKIRETVPMIQEQTTDEASEAETEAETKTESLTEAETEAMTETEEETESETEEEIESEAETEMETEVQTEEMTETEPQTETIPVNQVSGSVLPDYAEEPYLSSVLESTVVKEEEMSNLIRLLLDSGELVGNDGTGKIRPEQIDYELEPMYVDAQGNLTTDSSDAVKEGFYSAEFTLTDAWNRKAEHSMIIVIAEEVEGPILILNTRAVTLKAGENFNYLRYVEKASDPKDGDIGDRIQLEGQVDTSVPGTYQVKYFARNLSGVRSPKATLMVTVE